MRRKVRWITFFCAAIIVLGTLFFLWRSAVRTLDQTRRQNYLCAAVALRQGAAAVAQDLYTIAQTANVPAQTVFSLRDNIQRCRSAGNMLPLDGAEQAKSLQYFFEETDREICTALLTGRSLPNTERICSAAQVAEKIALEMEALSLRYLQQMPVGASAASYRAAAAESIRSLCEQLQMYEQTQPISIRTMADSNISQEQARQAAGAVIGRAAAYLSRQGHIYMPEQAYCFFCKNYSVAVAKSTAELLFLQAYFPQETTLVTASQAQAIACTFAEQYCADAGFVASAYEDGLFYHAFTTQEQTVYTVVSAGGRIVGFFKAT